MRCFTKVILLLVSTLLFYSTADADTINPLMINLQDEEGRPLARYSFTIRTEDEDITYETTDDGAYILYDIADGARLKIGEQEIALTDDAVQTFEVTSTEEHSAHDTADDETIQLRVIDDAYLPIQSGDVTLLKDGEAIDQQSIVQGEVTFQVGADDEYEVQYGENQLPVIPGEVRYFQVEPSIAETEQPEIAPVEPRRYHYPKKQQKPKSEDESSVKKPIFKPVPSAQQTRPTKKEHQSVSSAKSEKTITEEDKKTALPIQKPTKTEEPTEEPINDYEDIDQTDEDTVETETDKIVPKKSMDMPTTELPTTEDIQHEKLKSPPLKTKQTAPLPDTGEHFIYNGWIAGLLLISGVLLYWRAGHKKKNLHK